MKLNRGRFSVSSMSIMRLNFVVSRLLGLAPFEFIQSDKLLDNSYKFKCSYCGTIFNLVWVFLIFVIHLVCLYTACVEERADGTFSSQLIGIYLAASGTALLIFLPLKFLFNQRTIVNMANRLINVDLALNELRFVYNLNSGIVRLLLMTLANIICFLLVLISESLLLENSGASITIYVGQTIVLTSYITQYALVITLMEKRFASLNNALLRLNTSNGQTYTLNPSLNRSVIVEVIIIKRAYVILCDMCHEITNFYAAPIIFIVIHFSTSIMYSSYLMIITPMMKPGGTDIILVYVNTIFWLLYEIVPLMVLATSATRASNEMKKTSKVVHSLLVTYPASREYRRELKNFSLHLLHRNFRFTAYDMFPLDSSLINSIFSAIATYLVIFLQCQISGYKKSGKNSTTDMPLLIDTEPISLQLHY